MRKLCSVKSTVACGLLAAGLLIAVSARQAEARPSYMRWWSQTYPGVAKQNNVATQVKCNVCHIGAKDKKMRNDYAKAIEKALAPHKNLKPNQKTVFDEAIKKVEGEKSGTDGKTYGELLKDNELPTAPK